MKDAINKSPAAKAALKKQMQQRAAAAKKKREAKAAADRKMKAAIQNNPAARAKLKQQLQLQARIKQNVARGLNPDGSQPGTPQGNGTRPNPTTPAAPPPDATIAAIDALMRQYDMGDLWNHVKNNLILKDNLTDANAIWMNLRNDNTTKIGNQTVAEVYKKRFAANEKRVQNGMKELLPGDYVAYEDKVQSMISQALPGYRGFYDKRSDYTDLIANNVDAEDLQERINMAHAATQNADPGLVDSLQQFYGVGGNDLVAYFLDPTKAMTLVKQRYNAAQFDAAARKAGAQFSKNFAEEVGAQQDLASTDINAADNKMLQGISDDLNAARSLSSMYSSDAVSDEDVARSAMNMQGAGTIDQRKKRLASRERAAFGGKLSADSGTLSERKNI